MAGEAIQSPIPRKRWWRWGFEATWPVWVSVAVRIAVLVFLLAGGGSWLMNRIAPGTISAAELQDNVTSMVEDRLQASGVSAHARSAACEDLKERKGEISLCKVYVSTGDALTVQVTMQDSKGHFLMQIMG